LAVTGICLFTGEQLSINSPTFERTSEYFIPVGWSRGIWKIHLVDSHQT
jgi:hypothetical protein